MHNHEKTEGNFNTLEQEDEISQATDWGDLTSIPESETWSEHLDEADKLIHPTDELTPAETKEFLDYGDVARYNEKLFFQDLAQQEKLEREFNSELSHVEDLELLAEVEDPRVEKTTLKYLDQGIPVYILKDYPLKFLAHIINYREGDTILKIGTRTADELINNPKKWSEPYLPPKPDDLIGGWVRDGENARANTLSTSYADGTLRSFDQDLAHGDGDRPRSIIYGFDHIRPTTLIYARINDGQVPNYLEQGKSYRNRPIKALASSIDQLDTSKGELFSSYNEVAMFRYDEGGKPLEPSFMVTDNLSILLNTESLPEEETYWNMGDKYYQKRTNAFYMNRIKQHAAEHGIPIILIDRSTYGDKSSRGQQSADEYIAEHCSDVLAAGINPEFVKAKLSAEGVWQNYDTLKNYLPDLTIETEFINLINERLTNALKKIGGAPTDGERQQAYDEIVSEIIYGPDVYDYLERNGSMQLLTEIARKTGDEEMVSYTQQLSEYAS